MRQDILLDTCSLLWLSDDSPQLSATARKLIESADTKIFASSVSALEIGIKARRKRLQLPSKISLWYPMLLEQYDIIDLPPTWDICARAALLPSINSDPFDRLIIASAQISGLTIVTADTIFSKYPSTTVTF